MSSKILYHWTPERWFLTILSKNLVSRSAKRKSLAWEATLPSQRENSENGVDNVRTTGEGRQLLSFCAWLNQKMDFRYAVPVSPVLVLKVSISLWRRSSSKLVEAVWVSEHHWLLSLSAALSSFSWMSHYRRFPFPVSLYHLRGRLCFLLLASRSPCSSWRGMRRSSILMTCHIHRSWAWWVRPQCQYTLHGPGPLGLWYSLANACQVWNGGHASESSPAVWHPFGTVSKSRIHTAQRSRL